MSLIAELEAFDKGFRKLKRHLKDDEGAGENNKGAGSYPTRMLLLIVVLMEKLGISSKEAAPFKYIVSQFFNSTFFENFFIFLIAAQEVNHADSLNFPLAPCPEMI